MRLHLQPSYSKSILVWNNMRHLTTILATLLALGASAALAEELFARGIDPSAVFD